MAPPVGFDDWLWPAGDRPDGPERQRQHKHHLGTNGTLTVALLAGTTYACGGAGESDFSGSISDSGNGSLVMNGTGIYGMLGANSVSKLTVNPAPSRSMATAARAW